MNNRILVTGGTGNVGSEVIAELRASGAEFQIGARNPESARRMFGPDVEIVAFDFLDPKTYAAAFDGVTSLFLVRPPAISNVKRDIAPALWAAVGAGVQHVVFLSIQGVENNRMVPHHKIEQLILETGMDYTFLRAGFFMQNLSTTHQEEIRDRNEIALPVGQARTSFIDVRDIAAVAARTLTESGHRNQKYTLTGAKALTYTEVAAILSQVIDRPIRYTNPNALEFFRQQIASGQKVGYALVVTGLYTITRFGNASEVSDDMRRILGREPISFEQFARDHRERWIDEPVPVNDL